MIITGYFVGFHITEVTKKGYVPRIVIPDGIDPKFNDIDFSDTPNADGMFDCTITNGDTVFVLTDKFSAFSGAEVNLVPVKAVGGDGKERSAMLIQLVKGELVLEERGSVYTVDDKGTYTNLPSDTQIRWWVADEIENDLAQLMYLQYGIAEEPLKVRHTYADNLGYAVLLSTYKDTADSVCKSMRVADYLDLGCGKVAFIKHTTQNNNIADEDSDFDDDFYTDADDDIDVGYEVEDDDEDEDFYASAPLPTGKNIKGLSDEI